jgi:hypothetical protein
VLVDSAGNAALITAIVAAGTALLTTIVSTPLRYFIDKRALQHKLDAEYEYEQRKELRRLIGRYHGRILEAADAWHHRMRNLYKHEHEGWLDVDGDYANAGYYFRSTVYRFLVLSSLARRFEAEAFFIDARIAEARDLDFVKFVKAIRWITTDLDLVAGLPHEPNGAEDHFFADEWRQICDSFTAEGEPIEASVFDTRVAEGDFVRVLRFFDGLNADEPRLRWDRLVALHLLVIAFRSAIGYEMQRATDGDYGSAARRLRNPVVGTNLVRGLPLLGLAQHSEASRIRNALGIARQEPSRRRSWVVPKRRAGKVRQRADAAP